MEGSKTGALLACGAAIGAVLAGAPTDTVAALEAYGYHLGLAFQAVDDLLGIWGDPAVTGKPTWPTCGQRKKSLPVVAALATGGPAAGRLRDWLATPAPPPDHTEDDLAELRGIADLIEEAGGREWTAAEARRQVALAEQALAGAPVDPRRGGELVALARSLLGRSA